MKKTFLATAIATAVTVGTMGSAFAASNPFSDVPADHWAYDAVQQLASDGVIEGYGDATFRGQQSITRYEMAQMVAKAMAKGSETSAANKAIIDKLAAEFSDELKNLGVRVASLENKVDNVKWTGSLAYEYASERPAANEAGIKKQNSNKIILTLSPSMQINDNWTGHANIEHSMSANAGMSSSVGDASETYSENYTKVDAAYVEGAFSNFNVKLGRFDYVTENDGGLVMDSNVTGAQVAFGNALKATVTLGRHSDSPDKQWLTDDSKKYGGSTQSYAGLELNYVKDKFNIGAAYHYFGMKDFATAGLDDENVENIFGVKNSNGRPYGANSLGIWSLGFGYQLGSDFKFSAAYAKNPKGDFSSKLKKSYNIQLDYKGADPEVKGSYGLYVAYRQTTKASAFETTYDTAFDNSNQKGWEIGADYAPFKNVVASIKYFKGKQLLTENTDIKSSKIFGKIEFSF